MKGEEIKKIITNIKNKKSYQEDIENAKSKILELFLKDKDKDLSYEEREALKERVTNNQEKIAAIDKELKNLNLKDILKRRMSAIEQSSTFQALLKDVIERCYMLEIFKVGNNFRIEDAITNATKDGSLSLVKNMILEMVRSNINQYLGEQLPSKEIENLIITESKDPNILLTFVSSQQSNDISLPDNPDGTKAKAFTVIDCNGNGTLIKIKIVKNFIENFGKEFLYNLKSNKAAMTNRSQVECYIISSDSNSYFPGQTEEWTNRLFDRVSSYQAEDLKSGGFGFIKPGEVDVTDLMLELRNSHSIKEKIKEIKEEMQKASHEASAKYLM